MTENDEASTWFGWASLGFLGLACSGSPSSLSVDGRHRLRSRGTNIRALTAGMGVAHGRLMSHPRRVVPGARYLVTRRVYQRLFRLRPHPLTNQIAEYCAGWAAERSGVLLHSFVVMSNHQHLVVSDPRGALPDFLRELNRTMAKALNAAQGQRENLWSSEKASVVRLPTEADVLDMIAYCAANPVSAALVKTPEQWPGVNHWRPGTRKVVARPAVYFDPHGDMPAQVELRIEPLAMTEQPEGWLARVAEAVRLRVREARASLEQQGIGFVGSRDVTKSSFLARATSREERRKTSPVLAARDISVRRACQAIERAFRTAYRSALAAWRTGDRGAVFPFGTWWMAIHHSANVSPAPA